MLLAAASINAWSQDAPVFTEEDQKLYFGASAMKMFLKEYRKMKDQVIKAYTLGESIDDIALEFDMSPDCVKEIVNSYKRTK